MDTKRFEAADFGDLLPDPGTYRSTVIAARLSRSQRGNRMVEVHFALVGVPPGQGRVADYFVLEGASPGGLVVARRRLVELYRGCGCDPHIGEEICPQDLVGKKLEVQLDHQYRDGRVRLRVTAYRRLLHGTIDQDVPA